MKHKNEKEKANFSENNNDKNLSDKNANNENANKEEFSVKNTNGVNAGTNITPKFTIYHDASVEFNRQEDIVIRVIESQGICPTCGKKVFFEDLIHVEHNTNFPMPYSCDECCTDGFEFIRVRLCKG